MTVQTKNLKIRLLNRQRMSYNLAKVRSKFVNIQEKRKLTAKNKITQRYFALIASLVIVVGVVIYFSSFASEEIGQGTASAGSTTVVAVASGTNFVSGSILDFFCTKTGNIYSDCQKYEKTRKLTETKVEQYISEAQSKNSDYIYKLKKTIIQINKLKSKRTNERNNFVLSYIQNEIANYILQNFKPQIIISKSNTYYEGSYYQGGSYYQVGSYNTQYSGDQTIKPNQIQKIAVFKLQNTDIQSESIENLTLNFYTQTGFLNANMVSSIFVVYQDNLIEGKLIGNNVFFEKKINIGPNSSLDLHIFVKVPDVAVGYKLSLNCVDSNSSKIPVVCIQNYEYVQVQK